MSDYYQSYCHMVEVTKEEKTWFENYYGNKLDCAGCGEFFADPNLDDSDFCPKCKDRLFRFEEDEDGNYFPGFQMDVQEKSVYIYNDQGGIEQVITMLHEFLARFRPNGFQRLEWANHAQPVDVGAHHGGAAFITDIGITRFNTAQFLEEEQSKWDSQHGTAPGATPQS